MVRMFDVVTFDCYGTLIDWEGGIAKAFAEAGVSAAREAILALYAEIEPRVQTEAFRPYREVLAESAQRVCARLGMECREGGRWLAESLMRWQPFADTNAALERLQAAGYRLGILSNIDDDLLAGTRRHLRGEFEIVVTAAQVRSYKPALGHWQKARALVSGRWLHAAQSYFHDVVPARAQGLPVAWVNRKGEKALDEGGVDIEVPDLAGLATRLGA